MGENNFSPAGLPHGDVTRGSVTNVNMAKDAINAKCVTSVHEIFYSTAKSVSWDVG